MCMRTCAGMCVRGLGLPSSSSSSLMTQPPFLGCPGTDEGVGGVLKISFFFPFSGDAKVSGAEREKRDSDMKTGVHCLRNLTLCRERPITTDINQGKAVCYVAMAPLCIVIDCVRRICGVERRRRRRSKIYSKQNR